MDGKYYRKRKDCYLKRGLAQQSGFTRRKAPSVCGGARFGDAENGSGWKGCAGIATLRRGTGLGYSGGDKTWWETRLRHPYCTPKRLFSHSKRFFPFSVGGWNTWQMPAAASPCLPPALSAQGNPADWRDAGCSPRCPLGCQPRALLPWDTLSSMRIPTSPRCPPACPRIPSLGAVGTVPGAGPGSAGGSSSPASAAGTEEREPRESYYRLHLAAPVCSPGPNPANPTLPGAGVAAGSPAEAF